MSKVLGIVKKDPVLIAAWLLAVISIFFVPVSKDYISYIDFRSLGLLWSLMVIMKIFQNKGVFRTIGAGLIKKTHNMRQLAAVLIILCFVFSMLITNDVALITFVPFAIMMLSGCGRDDMLIPVIVLQTVAANLGSMMTPIGNPQNLYLYGLTGISFGSFIALVAPYTLLSLVLLIVCICMLKGGKEKITAMESSDEGITQLPVVLVYALLFICALLVVVHVMPFWILVCLTAAVSILLRQKSVLEVDYALLLTFVGFFIFTGNISKIPTVSAMLEKLVDGHEMAVGVVASQVISNVPAALLLSDFAKNLNHLILGVNIGGLGTLIASMASLISFKLYAAQAGAQKGKFMIRFTIVNVIFLIFLVAEYMIIG